MSDRSVVRGKRVGERRQTSEASLDAHLRQHVLQSGERVVWAGRPDVVRATQLAKRPTAIGAFLLVFIFLTIRLGIKEAGAEGPSIEGWGYVFMLVPVIFVALGVFLMMTPFQMRRAAKRTLYAVTERRVIILHGGRNIQVHAYLPASLTDVRKVKRREGATDIVLRKPDYSRWMSEVFLSGLWGIEDPEGAAAAIRALRTGIVD